jgi:hypothetical protein
MADSIRRIDYFYTLVPDLPAEGHRLLKSLQEAGVSLLAFSAFPIPGGKTQIDFVSSDSDRFLAAARDAGITLSERKRCFLVDGADRPGAVAEIVARLSEERINVTALDAVCGGAGRFGAILWVKPSAFEAAASALGA